MKRIRIKNKYLLIIIGLVLLLSITFITASILMKKSIKNNDFVIGTVIPKVKEKFTSGKKEDVYIKNEGNSSIYVRVMITYNFVDDNQNVLFETPILNNDYTITQSSSDNWILSNDGYYYYKKTLEPNEETDILIDKLEETSHDSNKLLDVNISVEGIQAHPDSAVREAWNVNINDGVLSLRN